MIENFTASDGCSLTFESRDNYVMVESCDPMLGGMIFVIDKKQAKQLAKALKEWAK